MSETELRRRSICCDILTSFFLSFAIVRADLYSSSWQPDELEMRGERWLNEQPKRQSNSETVTNKI